MGRVLRFLAALIGGLLLALVWILSGIDGPAAFDHPSAVRPSSKPLVLAVGDSLTHGSVSHNWMKDLKHAYPHIQFVNAARNGATTYTVLETVRSLQLPKRPELAIVLVGTNDAMALLSPLARHFYVLKGKMPPNAPTDLSAALRAYERNLGEIIRSLKGPLGAKRVIVMSPPPFGNAKIADALPSTNSVFGDPLERHPNEVVHRIARRAMWVAWRNGATAISLHSQLTQRILADPTPVDFFHATTAQLSAQFFRATALCLLPGLTWNDLSSSPLLHDLLHFNQRGAQHIIDALTPHISKLK